VLCSHSSKSNRCREYLGGITSFWWFHSAWREPSRPYRRGHTTSYGKGDWSELRLAASPLIAGEDLITSDWSTHTMRLKPEALARIPRPPVSGTPFVVVARGQRVYLGVFITIVSSRSFAVPAIAVDRSVMDPAQPRDTLVIERTYGASPSGAGADPRADERIKAALTALQKLTVGK